jgi:hypothetical protein
MRRIASSAVRESVSAYCMVWVARIACQSGRRSCGHAAQLQEERRYIRQVDRYRRTFRLPRFLSNFVRPGLQAIRATRGQERANRIRSPLRPRFSDDEEGSDKVNCRLYFELFQSPLRWSLSDRLWTKEQRRFPFPKKECRCRFVPGSRREEKIRDFLRNAPARIAHLRVITKGGLSAIRNGLRLATRERSRSRSIRIANEVPP